MIENYQPKTKPFKHQADVLKESAAQRSFAVFWEQGTGKTKLTIDNISAAYLAGEIDAVIVVAPGGVDRNWITDEIPAHMPQEVVDKMSAVLYQSQKSVTKWHQAELARLLHHSGLAFLAISYDAFMTKKGKNYIWKFLKKRRVFYVLDESHNVKSPGAKRTISIVASGVYARFRRLLTGTPVANGPFDVYSQMKFLEADFWKPHGFYTFAEFKSHFGEFEKKDIYVAGGDKREIDVLLNYRNLDELYEILDKAGSRVTKDEVLDLPPKLFSKRYFDLTAEQEKHYNELKTQFMTEVGGDVKCSECKGTGVYQTDLFEESCPSCGGYGEVKHVVDAPLAITRLLRLQQVTCGYLPTGDEQKLTPLGNRNPRLETLHEIIEPLGHKSIIWARFTHDIDLIMDMLERIGRRPVRYDGKISAEECARSKEAFQHGDATDFVGNPAKGKEGLTLWQARTVVYYNNSFKLIDRLQSEDRAHRIGQEHPVNYIDIQAYGTVDVGITDALRAKFDIATQITGDKFKEWI